MKFGEVHQPKKLEIVFKIGVVILSRFSSRRLPGKALKEIFEKKVLEYIIERVNQIFPLSNIVIATSNEYSDDPIAEFAKKYGVGLHRGSLENVSRRFYEAAFDKDWQYAIRINGDNIFMDTNILSQILNLATTNEFDFISNVKGRTFPKGMSVEAVKMVHYAKLLPKIESDQNYREHVTSYLYENDKNQNYHYIFNNTLPQIAGVQMALDTKEDFNKIQHIIAQFNKEHYHYNLEEIYNIMQNTNYEN